MLRALQYKWRCSKKKCCKQCGQVKTLMIILCTIYQLYGSLFIIFFSKMLQQKKCKQRVNAFCSILSEIGNTSKCGAFDEELDTSLIEWNESLEPIEGSVVKIDASTSMLACPHCTTKFQCNDKLIKHISDRHRNVCEHCGLNFTRPNSLRNHRTMKHGKDDVKTYSCPYDGCTKSFNRKALLEDHCNRHTNNGQRHQCDKCGKVFGNRYVRNNHVKRCGQSVTFKCPLCTKSFKSTESLRTHRLAIHEDSLYQCVQCGNTFKYLTGLRRHQREKGHRDT